MEDPEAWQRLIREQNRMVTRAQALAHGMTDEAIEANVAAGRWIPVFHGVYAVVTGELTPEMRRRGALLFIRGPAVLSHASAAAVLGLPGGREEGPIHVTVPPSPPDRGMYSCLPEHMIASYNRCVRWSRHTPPGASAYLLWGAEYWLLRARQGDDAYLRAFSRLLAGAVS